MNKRSRQLVTVAAGLVNPVIAARPDLDRPWSEVPGLSFRNETGEGGAPAELMIYGTIGGSWYDTGVTASDVAEALAGITASAIDVRINSGGGDAFDGLAIYTQLVRHSAYISTYVDGLAASAASVIAMAGDRLIMSDAGMLMIHDASTYTYGNGAAHRDGADLLDKISDVVAGVYANRAGEDSAHWRALMNAPSGDGTWYTAQEAYDAGLADEITGEPVNDRAQAAMRRACAVVRAQGVSIPERAQSLLAAQPARPDRPERIEVRAAPTPVVSGATGDAPAQTDLTDVAWAFALAADAIS